MQGNRKVIGLAGRAAFPNRTRQYLPLKKEEIKANLTPSLSSSRMTSCQTLHLGMLVQGHFAALS